MKEGWGLGAAVSTVPVVQIDYHGSTCMFPLILDYIHIIGNTTRQHNTSIQFTFCCWFLMGVSTELIFSTSVNTSLPAKDMERDRTWWSLLSVEPTDGINSWSSRCLTVLSTLSLNVGSTNVKLSYLQIHIHEVERKSQRDVPFIGEHEARRWCNLSTH